MVWENIFILKNKDSVMNFEILQIDSVNGFVLDWKCIKTNFDCYIRHKNKEGTENTVKILRMYSLS